MDVTRAKPCKQQWGEHSRAFCLFERSLMISIAPTELFRGPNVNINTGHTARYVVIPKMYILLRILH